jgi:dTDP-4-amino-4,6-dideoxygalactose transaminase
MGADLQSMNDTVLKSGHLVLGKFTEKLEENIAQVCNAKYAVTVGSGSDALYYGLVALNIKGKVAIPAQTYIATATSVSRAGCTPVCVDVKSNGLLNWNKVPKSINTIVWVGLFGNIEELPKNKFIIEDGAQHFGVPLHSKLASYSFDPTKNLPNFGTGGAVATNDNAIAENIKALRRHATVNNHVGGNSCMSERECAEMLVKLSYFSGWQKRRQEIAQKYIEGFGDLVEIITSLEGQCTKFVISSSSRNELESWLQEKQIETKRVYNQALSKLFWCTDFCLQANANCENFLSLPIDPYLTDKEISKVIRSVKEFF